MNVALLLFEERGAKMTGPFYVKDEDHGYIPAEMCADCAFFDEEDGICALARCIVFPEYENEEESEPEE